MINLREELKLILMREGTSMAKTLRDMKAQGYKVSQPSNMSKKVKDEWDIHKNPKSLRIDYEDETLDRSDSEQNENINEYINDRVKDTEEKIKMEIQRNNGKRFSEIEEVPSDKAKEILESIKRFK